MGGAADSQLAAYAQQNRLVLVTRDFDFADIRHYFRGKPSALMREARVVGFMPRSAAAPLGPKTLPWVWARAAAMLSRSRCLSSARVSSGLGAETAAAGAAARGRRARRRRVEDERAALREDDGAFDGVLQFADVARPVLRGELTGGRRGEFRRLAAEAFARRRG